MVNKQKLHPTKRIEIGCLQIGISANASIPLKPHITLHKPQMPWGFSAFVDVIMIYEPTWPVAAIAFMITSFIHHQYQTCFPYSNPKVPFPSPGGKARNASFLSWL